MPSPFIESDHPKIENLANKILSADDSTVIKAKKLVAWLHNNIEKRPVLSLPDALATLENRVGDCNEHAGKTKDSRQGGKSVRSIRDDLGNVWKVITGAGHFSTTE